MDHAILHALNTVFVRHDAIEDPIVAYVDAAELLFTGMLAFAFVLARGPPPARDAPRGRGSRD